MRLYEIDYVEIILLGINKRTGPAKATLKKYVKMWIYVPKIYKNRLIPNRGYVNLVRFDNNVEKF